MEGLEISVISFKNLERTLRIDAEFYQKENLHVLDILKSHGASSLVNFVNISDGNHMSISDKFIENGIPYYRGQDIHDFFIENTNPICIDEDSFNMPYMKRSHLHKGDVLLSIVGTIGGLSLVYSERKATCSCKLAILRPEKDISSELIATFLSSKYGQNQIKKYTRGAVQMGLILEDMDQLYVPDFSEEFGQIIENCITKAYRALEISVQLYEDVERVLLTELGLNDWKPTENTITTKSFEDYKISGRLDAEYYQPKYDEIERKLLEYGVIPVNESCKIKDTNFIPQDDICYKYIELSNISQYGEITGCTECLGRDLPTRARRLVMEGDLLISSIEGSLQSCAIVSRDYDGALCSTGFFVLKPVRMNVETLLLIFKSDAIQQLLKKGCSGTILTAISKDELFKIQLPLIDEKLQKEFAMALSTCLKLRVECKQRLECARSAIEVAIEQNEEQAIKLMNNHA